MIVAARLLSGMAIALGWLSGSLVPAEPHPSIPSDRLTFFQEASSQSGVPLPILIGLAWEQSHLSDHGGSPSIDRGYGLLDLSTRPAHDTLDAAARLVHVSPAALRLDDRLNLLGGALLLARFQHGFTRTLPRSLGAWAAAIVRFTGMRSHLAAELVVHNLYRALREGISASGIRLAAIPDIRPQSAVMRPSLSPLVRQAAGSSGADYSGAVWQPADSGNFTAANRPTSNHIRYIVIHDTEGSCASAVNWFQNPVAQGSAHYIVCADGTVIQTVREQDIAWHAGNWPVNQESIGIEHEGFESGAFYTRAQYLASAALVSYLTKKYGIDPNRNVIFGHENVPAANHTDPGPNWNWSFYMQRVRNDGLGFTGGSTGIAVMTDGALVYDCPKLSCSVLGSANWGEQFAITGEKPGWERIWYGGQVGWTPATGVAAGSGYLLRTITGATLRAGASLKDQPLDVILSGQTYVSTIRDGKFWYVAYNHRYAFLPAAAVRVTDCGMGHIAGCLVPSGSSLAVTPDAAPAGMPVTVEGTGLAPNAPIALSIGGRSVSSVQADGSGAFTARLTVPADAPVGKTEVTALDSSGSGSSTRLKVLSALHFAAELVLSQPQANPGSGCTIGGKGMPPEAAVTIKATFALVGGGTKTVTAHTFTQPDGTVAPVALNVPPKARPGSYTVTARAPGAEGRAMLSVASVVTPTPTVTASATPTPTATP